MSVFLFLELDSSAYCCPLATCVFLECIFQETMSSIDIFYIPANAVENLYNLNKSLKKDS